MKDALLIYRRHAFIFLLLLYATCASAQVDFRKETIYFLLTTRFFDGDPSNNRPTEWCSYGPNSPAITDPNDVTWRGDFKGLIQKLDYIKDLGFTAIWITPIVHNRGPLDYHGYHAWDFTKVDPRLESPGATFQDLINEVHARGMKIVLDIVTNHSGRFGIKGKAELKYNTDPSAAWYAPDNAAWEYDGLTANPYDGKIWSRANLAKLPPPYNSNLAAYNWPCTESFVNTSDPGWFHHSGNGFAQGWDDTENLQNRALAGDCPDLNTGSQTVRDYLVAAYTKFINMGVDAFRWDTMKHMDKADALYFLDKFKQANPDLFVFAEVAQLRHELHNVEEINPHWYTWRGGVGSSPSGMSVIDFYGHASFHNVFEDGGALNGMKAAARFDHLYSDPSSLITWLDNHDFGPNNDWNRRFGGTAENLASCMNFMFTWRGIPAVYYGTEMQFMKGAYCDIHGSAAINQSLNLTGRAYYGDEMSNAPQHRIYQHIKKLNAMRRAVPALQNGNWQWAGGDHTNGVGYVRKSGASEVAVGLAKDGEVTFNFSGLTNGTYRDAVTGRAVSVSNGNLSFTVKPASAGVYVLNGPGMIGENGVGFFELGVNADGPVLTIETPAGQYSEPLQISMTATGQSTPVRIYYTTDGTTPGPGSTLYSGAITLNASATVRAIAIDGSNRSSSVQSAQYVIGDVEGLTVHFRKPPNWSGAVRLYYWNVSPAGAATSAQWPGNLMRYDSDTQWYSYTLPGVVSASIIFNDGSSQTADLSRSSEGWYVDGQWYGANPDGVNEAPVLTVTPEGPRAFVGSINVTASVFDESDEAPLIYYTTDGTDPSTSSGSSVGSIALSFSATTTLKLFARDNAGLASPVQTHVFTKEQSAGLTVHLKSNWGSPRIYYWNANGSVTTWPGAAMNSEGDEWWSYTIPNASCANIIFSDNGASQTSDLFRCGEGWYDGGTWYDSKPTEAGLKIHLKTGWANPRLYFWNASPATAAIGWPGVSMTAEGNGWFVASIPGANCANLIFSNNGASQTADLYRCGEGWYNNGVWYNHAPMSSSQETGKIEVERSAKLSHFPNPVRGECTFSFSLDQSAEVNIHVQNLQGIELMRIREGKMERGRHLVSADVSSLQPGVYIYKLTIPGSVQQNKMIVIE